MFRYLLISIILLVVLVGCRDETPSLDDVPPLNVTVRSIAANDSYLTLTVNQIEFLEGVGDVFGEGEFRLYMLVGDNQAISGGLFCPGGAPLKVVPSTGIVPCNLALSVPEHALQDELYIVLIGVDEDQGSAAADLAGEAATSLISYRLVDAAKAAYKAKYLAATTGGPGLAVVAGGLLLEVVVGFAGSQVQEWVEQRDVIGFQVLRLSHEDDWHIGKELTFTTSDEALNIGLSIQRTTSPGPFVAGPVATATRVTEAEPTMIPTAEIQNEPVASATPEQPEPINPTSVPTPISATTLPEPSNWQQGRLVFLSGNNPKTLFMLDLGGNQDSAQALFTSDQLLLGPVLSPDGSHVVLYEPNGQLFIIDTQSGRLRTISHECTSPVWSADGRQLLCRSRQPDTFDIVDAQTGDLHQQIPRPVGAVLPHWSYTRNEIVFARLDGEITMIYRMSLSDARPVLLIEGASQTYAPSWSPDGNWIAYQSNEGSQDSEIWVADRNGQNAYRLTQTPGNGWSRGPSWSPDGDWVAFVSNRAGSIGPDYGEVFVTAIESGETYQLTFTGGAIYDWRVSWSN